MLTDKLREGAHGKVFKILFWIIILSFVFAGVGNYLIPKLDTDPVEIGKIKVTANQWNQSYQDQVRSMQQNYGPQVNDLLEQPQYVRALRMQVLERIIDSAAISSVTYEEGIRIGDDEVKAAIRKEPAFQKDGKFNQELFNATMRNIGSTPDYFAEQMRLRMAQDTLIEPLVKVAAIPYPYEISMFAELFAKERTVDLYSIDLAKLQKEISVSEDDIKKYYEGHKNEFVKPAEVNFNYIVLSTADIKKTIEAKDNDVEDYYNMNSADFKIPTKRECSQILIKSSVENFENKASEALSELKKGASFDAVAKKYAGENFKDSMSLGLVAEGDLSAALDKALYAIPKVGDYSEVVVDAYGAHILRLDSIKDAHVPAFAEIKSEVKEKYLEAKAFEIYTEKSATLTDVAYENPDSLDTAAKAVGQSIKSSGNLAYGDSAAEWPLNTPEVQKAAFSEENRTSMQNSPVISLGNDACAVINVTSYQEAQQLELSKVMNVATIATKTEMAKVKANTTLAAISNDVKNGKTPDLGGAEVTKDVLMVRGDTKYDPAFVYDVFAIVNAENQSIISSNKGKPTLAVLKKESVNEESKEGYEKFMQSQLVQFKVDKIRSILYLAARDISKVIYHEDAINLVNQQNSTDN